MRWLDCPPDLPLPRTSALRLLKHYRFSHIQPTSASLVGFWYNPAMPTLTISNAHVSINDTPILKGVSLTIKPGEIHAVMGPNGSGKSTLAATLAGHPSYTVDETKTQLKLGELDLLQMSPDERARAGLFLAFQYPTEIPGVSVQNFLRAMWTARFGPIGNTKNTEKTYSVAHGNRQFENVLAFREYLKEVAKQLKVKPELLARNLNEGFSGGERKRVEILQMAVFEPSIAILDETDSGLDIDAVKTVAQGARDVAQKFQTGVLVITHYKRILQFLKPDFVHVLAHGQIVESGGIELAQRLEKEGYAKYT